MRRGAAKVDRNQREIVSALTRCGATVESLHRNGGGVPDLLVGIAGRNYLLEVKAAKGRKTPDQIAWHAAWRGQKAVVRSIDEALYVVGLSASSKAI